MTLRDRVPVEPLEEERLARIERAVVAGLPARRPRTSPWRVAAPIAALAVAAAALLVVLRPRDDQASPPADDAPVVVSAAPDGARVDLGEAAITTGAGATFTVTRPGGGIAVHLARGRIELDVAPRKGRPPLVVHADDVEVVVVGTRFAVEWDDEVTVTVMEGLVRVQRGGRTDMVAAGETWSEPARVAVAVVGPDEARAGALPPAPEAEPVVEAPAPPPRKPKVKDKEKPERDAPPVAVDPFEELRTDIKEAPYAPAVDVGVKGEQAIAEYQKMSIKTGDEGSQGLYGLARAQMAAGRRSEALRNLDRYVQRFSRGAELEDVLWLRLRILCLETIDTKCRRAAHTFLAKFPDSSRADTAVRVTNSD
jgi:hypothetical protein